MALKWYNKRAQGAYDLIVWVFVLDPVGVAAPAGFFMLLFGKCCGMLSVALPVYGRRLAPFQG